jgi:7-cyano-7-deazaguanine synthase in queuosine biosynthesis
MNTGNDVPWELPPEYHDEPDPPPEDCLGCGRCEACVQRCR